MDHHHHPASEQSNENIILASIQFEHLREPSQQNFPESILQLHDFSNAFSRLIFVSFLLIFNLFEILRSVFFRKQSHCIHSCVYSSLLLISNLYLLWWLPYLFTSYRFGTVIPVMTSLQTHCGLQHKFSLELSTSILVILVYRSLFESFSLSRAQFLAQAIFIIWILPQFVYSAILEFSTSNNLLYILDGLHTPEMMTFSQSGNDIYGFDNNLHHLHSRPANLTDSQSDKIQTHLHNNSSLPGNGTNLKNDSTSGVLLCVHRLTTGTVHGMTWHYMALIVPLTSLLIICIGARRFAASTLRVPITTNNKNGNVRLPALTYRTPPGLVHCDCSADIIVTTILFTNFAWLLVGRPLSALIKLLEFDLNDSSLSLSSPTQVSPLLEMSSNTTNSAKVHSIAVSSSIENVHSFILDFGTHFILFILVILLPFSRQFGFLASVSVSHKPY